MLYVVRASFKPGVEAQRTALSRDFGEHMKQPLLHIRLVGALFDEGGGRTGLLMLMEAEDRQQLDHFLESSPYRQADLYDRVDIDVLQIEAGGLQ